MHQDVKETINLIDFSEEKNGIQALSQQEMESLHPGLDLGPTRKQFSRSLFYINWSTEHISTLIGAGGTRLTSNPSVTGTLN